MIRKQRAKPRKPPLLPSLLAALDARPDVTVLTRTWPVLFVQLRYVLEKTVVNPNGMSPLHRETPLFFGQAFRIERPATLAIIYPIPGSIGEGVELLRDADALLDAMLGPIHPEVAAKLGLAAPVEREPAIVGRAMER